MPATACRAAKVEACAAIAAAGIQCIDTGYVRNRIPDQAVNDAIAVLARLCVE
jgi:hypothetical protein